MDDNFEAETVIETAEEAIAPVAETKKSVAEQVDHEHPCDFITVINCLLPGPHVGLI